MRSPNRPHSTANDRVSASSPAFAAAEWAAPGTSRDPSALPTLTATPGRPASISGSAHRRSVRKAPLSPVSTTAPKTAGRDLLGRRQERARGRVDEQLDRTAARLGSLEHSVEVRRLTDGTGCRVDLSGQLGGERDGLRQRLLTPSDDRHLDARLRQHQRDSTAQAAASAGDDRPPKCGLQGPG